MFLDRRLLVEPFHYPFKALPHVTISSTMVFNVAKIASAHSSSTISLTKSLRVAGPLAQHSAGVSKQLS